MSKLLSYLDEFMNGLTRQKKFAFLFTITSIVVLNISSCKNDVKPGKAFEGATPYTLNRLQGMPEMTIPENNPMTQEAVFLGRKLFKDSILSGDNTQSCASCHQQEASFVDKGMKFSIGIDGKEGLRNTMDLTNVGYGERFFWDGRAASLEDLIRMPIEDKLEMHEDVEHAVSELQAHPDYPDLFYNAFGTKEITTELLSKAVAQYLRTIIGGNQAINGNLGQAFRDEKAERGYRVFINEEKGDCFHCHEVTILNTIRSFKNNGLNADPSLDPGLGNVTNEASDIGKFKVPNLYNLIYTAPYMHDGRFNTLEEVINFYDTGFHVSATLDANLMKHAKDGKPIPRTWTALEKDDLIYFIKSLTDENLLNSTDF